MTKKTKRISRRAGTALLAAGLCVTMLTSTVTSAFAMTTVSSDGKLGANGGKYVSQFDSNEQLKAETKKTNIEAVSEGIILLKNGGGTYNGADHSEHKLPFKNMTNVSLFGISSDAFCYGGTGSAAGKLEEGADIYSSFANAGINVNPKLKELYQKYSGGPIGVAGGFSTSGYSDKELDLDYYTNSVTSTYDRYKDAAIVFISRFGGEEEDLPRLNVPNRVRPDANGQLVKSTDEHYLELSYREEQLIKHVEDNFDKVIVLLNSGNIIEFGELENDPRIDAVLNIGQTGDYGFDGVIKVLKGEVNPSGRTVDICPADFTADPTWRNFGDNRQNPYQPKEGEEKYLDDFHDNEGTGINFEYSYRKPGGNSDTNGGVYHGLEVYGVEYEEGLYMGYRYYETMYGEIKGGSVKLDAEATKKALNTKDLLGENYLTAQYKDADDWYAKNVVYPFGYGLSYTEFEWAFKSLEMDTTELTKETKFTATVEVSNIGKVAGKDVVELYMTAPYKAGGIEKSATQLIGFAKTDIIQPGSKQEVTIEFDAYDIAAYDYSGVGENATDIGYKIESGDYKFVAAKNSHDAMTSDLAQTKKFTYLHLNTSQGSGKEIENVFVDPNYGTDKQATEDKWFVWDSYYYNFSTISPTMTIMSRGKLIETFPVPSTVDERSFNYFATENGKKTEKFKPANELTEGKNYGITGWELFLVNQSRFDFGGNSDYFDEGQIWDNETVTVPDSWTQAADASGAVNVRLPELMGYSPYDNDTIVESANEYINGKTAAAAWEYFMNQLTYDELQHLSLDGFFKTVALERFGKEMAYDCDGPATIGGQTVDGYISNEKRGTSGTRYWLNAQTLAASWNTELANRVGTLIGEEGLWNGYNGWYAPSMNIHRSPFSGRNFEYYSQDGVQGGLIAAEVVRGAQSKGVYCYIKHFAVNDQETARKRILTWADEQVIREIYLKCFEYAVVDGGAAGVMAGYNYLGTVPCVENYALMRSLLREEWGFCGIVVSDYHDMEKGSWYKNIDISTRAGVTMPLANNYPWDGCGSWDASLRNGKGGVVGGHSERSNEIQYYFYRVNSMELLYTHCRSSAMDNGADFQKNFPAQTITLPAGIASGATGKSYKLTNGFGKYDDVKFEIVKDELPEGVNFDLKTLTFTSGNDTEVSKGAITIRVSYDSWASKDVRFPVNVIEPITYTGATSLAKGAAYEAKAAQDFWASSATFSASGLPAGLTMAADGTISGTPTTAGVYNVSIRCSASAAVKNVTLTVGTLINVTVDGKQITVEEDSEVSVLPVPEAPAEGMKFVGWMLDGELMNDDDYLEAGNVLTAKFAVVPDDVQFRVHDGMIQASVSGGEWTDVIAVSELKGDKGDQGIQGIQGEQGEPGKNGSDGKDGENGKDAEGGCGSSVSALPVIGMLMAGAVVYFIVRRARKQDK